MTWIWAFVGGLLGLLLDADRVLGLCLGAAVAALAAMLRDQRQRLAALEGELQELRRQPRDPSVAATPPPFVANVEAVAPSQAAAPTAATTPSSQQLPPPLPPRLPAQPAATPSPQTPSSQTPSPQTPPPRTTPPPLPTSPPLRIPPQPSPFDRALGAVKGWFTEGNVPVKIGVLVLFVGVAAALRFAAAEGYFTLPIGWRASLIAAAALAGLALGWRERKRRKTFGLSLQGGAIGVLLLTVFASYRLYGLLPAKVAFAFVVVLVAGAAALAMLQRAMTLGALGFLGGYLAPVLLSTGSGNHVALFSYYAVLNGAVFAISWRHRWRLLNLIGFTFTFGVSAIWLARSYHRDLFWTVEPFLVLFFLFYVAIGLLYALRKSEPERPWLDGTLIFGTPLAAFPMQALLLRDEPTALAFSAVAVAAIYLGLLFWLRTRRDQRLLTEAYAALALGFATLAVPLAFSAATTASLWALQGVGVAWMGLRQGRTTPWLSGLGLQLLAAGAFVYGEIDRSGQHPMLLLNGTWIGAALLGFAGMALARIHDLYKPVFALPALCMVWGLGWWTCAGLTQLSVASQSIPGGHAEWQFSTLYLSASLLAMGGLRRWLAWGRLGWGMGLWALFAFLCVPWANDQFGRVFSAVSTPVWLVYFIVMLAVLRWNRDGSARSVALTHAAGLWTLTLAATLQVGEALDAGTGWRFLAITAPLGLLTLGLWRRPRWFAWPRSEAFESRYRLLWFGLALPLLSLIWLAGLFHPGRSQPLPYLPLLNPLELGLLAVAVLLWGYCRDRFPQIVDLTPLWVGVAFAFLSLGTLRAVHHLHGEPWSFNILDSGFAQTSLTVVWSLIGVTAWIAGSRLSRRPLWLAGAGLMGLVLMKLILIDRQYMGNIPGIVSFLAVGLLLVVVGYFAPSPGQGEESK